MLVLVASSLSAARETEPLPPAPQSAAAPFSDPEGPPVLLSRVYPSAARDNEFVEIANARLEPVDVSGWSLTDGEATARFPLDAVLPGGGRLLVTHNATSLAEDTLLAADFTFGEGAARQMDGRAPRLADAGDEVVLLDAAGKIVDVFVWGGSTYDGPGWSGRPAEKPGRGELAVRASTDRGGWIDRDAAEDWEDLRRHRLGQSEFESPWFDLDGATTAVISPDEGDEPLLRFFASAQASVDVAVYTLTNDRVASILASDARRGVRVRVLLDGSPVGGIDEDAHRIVGGLLDAGVEVRWLVGSSDVVKRYRYLHAKYAVVDARAAWIGSENFGEAGFPQDRRGNRGWSVVAEDADLADALESVFDADFDARRRDSVAATETSVALLSPPPSPRPWSSREPAASRRARLVLAPDTALDADGVLGAFAAAQERISVQGFYLEDEWGDAPNPFLDAAFAAARRGVSVRILLDGSWGSVEAESGTNDDVVGRINERAMAEHVAIEARLLAPRGSIDRLHNKGAVIDGRTVLVSSMNWAHGSATENREVGLLIEDAGLAATFEAAFNADWDGRPSGSVDEWLADPLTLAGLYAFVGVASALSLRKLRAGTKAIKPRARVRTRGSPRADLRRGRGEVRLLSPELVAQPRARAGRGRGARRGGETARGRVRGPEGD